MDCIVVGAGAIGLACARALALSGLQTVVLEEQPGVGRGVSSRSSEVVHAGLYYEPGSLKARMCVEGGELLYRYLAERNLPHRRLGKLIVATDNTQLAALSDLQRKAQANGAGTLAWLEADEAAALEPRLKCAAGLLSPRSGIVDSHALMLSLQRDLESSGGHVVCRSPMRRARRLDGVWEVTAGSGEPFRIGCDLLVNAAGLSAQQVAAAIEGIAAVTIPALRLARGCYFSLSGPAPFRRLIYPLPADGGLGIHLTLDLQGMARFGPDVEWIQTIGYEVDPRRAEHFYPMIRRYWPQLPDGSLQPAYAGIRPKLSGPGEPAADFVIMGPEHHGLAGLIQLFGIESPGLTSALAIADRVWRLSKDMQ